MLILDEPTSGVDPVGARPVLGIADRSFAQSRRDDFRLDPFHERGRALRPDLADGFGARARRPVRRRSSSRPAASPRSRTRSSAISKRRRDRAAPRPRTPAPAEERRGCSATRRRRSVRVFSLRRLFAYTIRETLELLRDPIRLGVRLFGTALLMLVFGFGISTDVNNLSFAVLDHDQSPESRAYLEELQRLDLFRREGAARRLRRARQASQKRQTSRPPSKSRPASAATSSAGAPPGSAPGWMAPCRSAPRPSAAICRACIELYLADPAVKTTAPAAAAARRHRSPVQVQSGFRQHLCDGACESWRCCSRCFRRS